MAGVSFKRVFSASKIHTGSWWLLAICLAIAAGLTRNFFVLVAVIGFALLVIRICREDAPWSRSIGFYLRLAGFVIAVRLLFRLVFNFAGAAPDDVLFSLPSVTLNLGIGNQVVLFGDISSMSMQAALIDGLRLSAIIVAIGLANSLANPRKLLKSTPSALYEIATALSVAINLAPQLIASLQRVRRARGLRGGSRGLGSLRGIVIPVLEDTIEQSLQLAASMDARGFGRKGSRGRGEVMLARVSGFGAVVLSGIGVYVLLAVAGNSALGLGLIAAAFALGALTVKLSSLRKTRTKFRREPWRPGNWVIVLLAAAIMGCALTGVFA